ncbi:hypothetical protein LIA77_06302 [Sarocladium implicatum]|nr:hypothetical protein LIA77_06302 [Sarocladium implicatum]
MSFVTDTAMDSPARPARPAGSFDANRSPRLQKPQYPIAWRLGVERTAQTHSHRPLQRSLQLAKPGMIVAVVMEGGIPALGYCNGRGNIRHLVEGSQHARKQSKMLSRDARIEHMAFQEP